MPTSPDPGGAPVQEYRLRIHPQQSDHAWRAELCDVASPSDVAPLTFDTPLELARHLAQNSAGRTTTSKPGAGLR